MPIYQLVHAIAVTVTVVEQGVCRGTLTWMLFVRKWALRARAAPSKSPSFMAIILIILILPAPSLCPGKVPLITLVKTTSVVGNLHNIRYCVNNDLCNAWNVTTTACVAASCQPLLPLVGRARVRGGLDPMTACMTICDQGGGKVHRWDCKLGGALAQTGPLALATPCLRGYLESGMHFHPPFVRTESCYRAAKRARFVAAGEEHQHVDQSTLAGTAAPLPSTSSAAPQLADLEDAAVQPIGKVSYPLPTPTQAECLPLLLTGAQLDKV